MTRKPTMIPPSVVPRQAQNAMWYARRRIGNKPSCRVRFMRVTAMATRTASRANAATRSRNVALGYTARSVGTTVDDGGAAPAAVASAATLASGTNELTGAV